MEIKELSDADLMEQVAKWRSAALRGSREARGKAHALEVELRRRKGVSGLRTNDDIDLRPLEEREHQGGWWGKA